MAFSIPAKYPVVEGRACREINTDIGPTVYPSEMSISLIGDGVFPKKKIPAQRSVTEEDVAGCIMYMTSQAGSYCNGNVVVSDGGRLSVTPATY